MPKETQVTKADLAGLVAEARQATAQQRRELQSQTPSTPQGTALQNILQVLQILEEWIPALTEQQRVLLATGNGLGMRTLAETDLEEVIFATWWKAGDRDAFDLKVQILMADGVLKSSARLMLKRIRGRVADRLMEQQLPRFEVLDWSAAEVKRRAGDEGLSSGVEGLATELANEVLEAYEAGLQDADGLVYGRLTVEDARLWIDCSEHVLNKSDRRSDETREQLLRRVMLMFNKVRTNGCESVAQLKMRQEEKRGGWGVSNEYRVNSRGQWVDGKNVAVEWKQTECGMRMEREDIGFAPIFAHKGIVEVMAEVRRAEEIRGSR